MPSGYSTIYDSLCRVFGSIDVDVNIVADAEGVLFDSSVDNRTSNGN